MPAGTSSLGAIFGPRTLTNYVRTFDSSQTDRMFTTLFQQNGRKLAPDGRKVTWNQQKSSRGLAPIVGLNSPAPKTKNVNFKEQIADLILVKEQRFIPWDKLFLDPSPGSALKPNAQDTLNTTLDDMTLEVGKTREYACSRAVHSGGIVVDATKVPGSDIVDTYDYGVGTLTATASWATAGTAILSSELPLVQADRVAACGMPMGQALINDKVYKNILANTEIQSFGKNERWAENFLRANVTDPAVLKGIAIADIMFRANAYGYKPTPTTAYTRWIDDDTVIFLPDSAMLPQVLGYSEQVYPVPMNTWGPAGDVGFDLKPGIVAWCKYSDDPAGVEVFVCLYFLPVVMFGEAVLAFDTTP
jgi:hypothetical protein